VACCAGSSAIPSLVWAQQQELGNPEKPQSAPSVNLRLTYQVLTERQQVHQGANEKAVIRLSMGPFNIVSPNETSHDFVPMKITFEETDGISAGSIKLRFDRLKSFTFHDKAARKDAMLEPPDDNAYKVPETSESGRNGDPRQPSNKGMKFSDTRVRVLPTSLEAATMNLIVKLKVSKKAGLGAHLLRGTITYQPIFDNGVLPPQTMEVIVPVVVVSPGEKSTINPEYTMSPLASFDAAPKHDLLWMILLSPIFIPLEILSMIVCGVRGEDCSC